VRYDKVELVVIYWRKNKPVYRRIPACLTKNFNREPQLLFTSAPLVRITDGPRPGRVVTDEEVLPTESYEPAGVYKRLTLGSGQSEFSPINHKDIKYGESLQLLCHDILRDEVSQSFELPFSYLTYRGGGTHLLRKGSEDWYKAISGTSEFSVESLPECCKVQAGDGRIGLPFEHVYGKGVVAMDPMHMGVWKCVPLYELNICKPHLKVSIQ
jgi:hypothetical protein